MIRMSMWTWLQSMEGCSDTAALAPEVGGDALEETDGPPLFGSDADTKDDLDHEDFFPVPDVCLLLASPCLVFYQIFPLNWSSSPSLIR